MKTYKSYELSEIFNRIDKLLQTYFGKENVYEFYKKDDEEYKTDLSKKSYLMFLSNGDRVKVKIPKSSLPHLLGINTEYLKNTGLYGNKGSYEIMLDFIRNSQDAIKKHEENIIDLNKVLSPYISVKIDALISNLSINTNYCEMVCKYDKEKTYGYSEDFDDMAYLILQKKNDKYYVLKLAKTNDQYEQYYPMSNQVFDTYEELQENLSSYLFNQETTLLNSIKVYLNNIPNGNFYIQEWNRREKLENLRTLSKDLECTPNVLNDYIYSLKIRDDKREDSIHDSSTMEILCNCMRSKVPFELDKKSVESEELIQLINAYNDSLFESVNIDVDKTYSDLKETNNKLGEEIAALKSENSKMEKELEEKNAELKKAEVRYKDAESKIDEVKRILN